MAIPSRSETFSSFTYLRESKDKTVNLELADLSESAEQTVELSKSNNSQLTKIETCCKGRQKLCAIVFAIIIILAGLPVFVYMVTGKVFAML